MPKLDPIERAENYLALAQDSDTAPDKAQALRLEAVTLGLLAVAHEMRELREAVSWAGEALVDPHGGGNAGANLHYIADFLKKIAER
ncbi:hypothetical protein ABZX66_20975 [Micromonospora aurantiaca]|uniref:hypothetical protein n=1 Tax=Micromonospora aurantiaca (nom. illeg.) TaxID=47850 RepID=UPI0033B77617